MERVPKIQSFLISTMKSEIKDLMMNRLLLYGLLLSFSILVSPMTASAYSGDIYLSSFQDINWQINLTGEIYYNFGGQGSGSPTYYSYCVEKSAPLPIPGTYHAESSAITGNTGLLKAAWLIDHYAASKPYTYSSSTYTLDSIQTGVALQLAVWDQLAGQGISFESPKYDGYENLFAAKDYFDIQVSQVLPDDLSSYASKYNVLKIYMMDGSGNHLQDIESLSPVPVPAAFLLFGSGLLGLLGMRRKITLPAI